MEKQTDQKLGFDTLVF